MKDDYSFVHFWNFLFRERIVFFLFIVAIFVLSVEFVCVFFISFAVDACARCFTITSAFVFYNILLSEFGYH